MLNVKTVIELENKFSKKEQEKVLDFLENEFGIRNENVKIFAASTYATESEFASEIYNKVNQILVDDFKEY
ncbi:hypothetical protein LXN10_13725 [Arcobacter sp. KX21116]|jgi:uncharacterized tellurite resistance protein B-like protein|uniref:hypothetical protein n=1 Tax=Arcobacter iocasae TaxID=2906515 RepID=UPI0035D3EBEF|tara:strand:- start:38259 stop:38471 length:213 start_codon:yes stop_codon:yes gene_type:complete